MVPFDERSPFVTSGIRIGSSAITTRGLVEDDMAQIIDWIDQVISDPENETLLAGIKAEVSGKMSAFPLFQ